MDPLCCGNDLWSVDLYFAQECCVSYFAQECCVSVLFLTITYQHFNTRLVCAMTIRVVDTSDVVASWSNITLQCAREIVTAKLGREPNDTSEMVQILIRSMLADLQHCLTHETLDEDIAARWKGVKQRIATEIVTTKLGRAPSDNNELLQILNQMPRRSSIRTLLTDVQLLKETHLRTHRAHENLRRVRSRSRSRVDLRDPPQPIDVADASE